MSFSSRDYDAREDMQILDLKLIAENVIREHLIKTFHDMEILDVMDADIDCQVLSNEDYNTVLQAIESAKVSVAVQL